MGSRLEKNSQSVRKRIEGHSFEDEEGEEYEGSKFGGFSDYFRRKKIKLQNLDAEVRAASQGKPSIFRGVVAHVNGYTQPSLNDLHHLIVSHGGGFMQYLDGKTMVTHIIAANLTPKKAIEFRRYRIVKPAWVVDSVAAGKLLSWDGYRVVDEGVGQRLLAFDDGKVVSHANTQPGGYREQTNTSWYTNQFTVGVDETKEEDSALFTRQQVVENTTNSAFPPTSERPPISGESDIGSHAQLEDQPDSLADFEITPSMENALEAAETWDSPENETTAPKYVGSGQLSRSPRHYFDRPYSPSSVVSLASHSPMLPNPVDGLPFSPHSFSEEAEFSGPSKHAKELTAEEHNALLLADPRMRKSSTGNPDFIRQYYAESRLHHLSTWKSDLKSRFQQMAAELTSSQKQSSKRKPGARRYIMHVDFDSFFCAVSLQSAPQYADKPAVVAHGTGPGSEIASCNYPARKFGIKNGMWMKQALNLFSDIKVLPYDFPAYEKASKGFYEAILDVGGIVQSVSIDEALIDVTALALPAGGTDGVGSSEGSIRREQEKADQIATLLRRRIKDITGCDVSIGIGGNVLLAKVSLRRAKPAGQHQIKPDEVIEFLGELDVKDLPGVAHSIGRKLEEIGVKLVKDVRQLSKERLTVVLGPKTGEKIWDYSRGIDRTEVGEQVVRKSVSAEVNWGIRFISQEEAEEFVQNLCGELHRRLVEQKVKGVQLTIKIKRRAADAPLDPPKNLGHGKCDTFSKSIAFGVATNSAEIIGREAVSILRSYGFSPGELRGLGIQMQKLVPVKADAFDVGSQKRLGFSRLSSAKITETSLEDPIDDPEIPEKLKAPSFDSLSSGSPQDGVDSFPVVEKRRLPHRSTIENDDPIDDKFSPYKLKATPLHPATFISRNYAGDQSARKLNLTGTQFIVPSQIDPEVLSELTPDLRSRLIAQSKLHASSDTRKPGSKSRSQSHFPPKAEPPLPSQLDPEVFDALPLDLKAEILASYPANAAGPSRITAQSLLPQSPRKPRPLPSLRKTTTTPTKKRGRPLGSRNRKPDPSSTLKQSAFIATTKNKSGDQVSDSEDYLSETLEADFLCALPENVRTEVIAEHRRKQLARKGGLLTALSHGPRKHYHIPLEEGDIAVIRKLKLPPKEPKPTFTTRELSTLEDLRAMVGDWVREFAEDGPLDEDMGALGRYLGRVVREERDTGKAVAIVKWIGWLVDNIEEGGGKRVWERGVGELQDVVQEALQELGRGRVEF